MKLLSINRWLSVSILAASSGFWLPSCSEKKPRPELTLFPDSIGFSDVLPNPYGKIEAEKGYYKIDHEVSSQLAVKRISDSTSQWHFEVLFPPLNDPKLSEAAARMELLFIYSLAESLSAAPTEGGSSLEIDLLDKDSFTISTLSVQHLKWVEVEESHKGRFSTQPRKALRFEGAMKEDPRIHNDSNSIRLKFDPSDKFKAAFTARLKEDALLSKAASEK